MSKRSFDSRAAEPKASYAPGSRTLQVAEDIIPIAEFKTKIGDYVRALDSRVRPMVITLNGKPAAVVMSPREYDRLIYRERVIASINAGLADVEAGRVMTSEQVRGRLDARYGALPKRKRR